MRGGLTPLPSELDAHVDVVVDDALVEFSYYNERNLPLYSRHAFAVTSEYLADEGRGPRTWSMLRGAELAAAA